MNYTEQDLVTFGEYLLSSKRDEMFKNTTGLPAFDFEMHKKNVHHADIENWKHQQNSRQQMCGGLKVFYVIQTEPEADFCDKTFNSSELAEIWLAENVTDAQDNLSFEIKKCYIK